MIVVDTNVLAYFYLPSELSPQAARLRERDPHWVAPHLWRSEFRNVLSLYLRKGMRSLDQAFTIQTRAETLLADCEYEGPSFEVLQLADESSGSAPECAFVPLAKLLHTPLITSDKKLLTAFPKIAMSLAEASA